MHFIIFSGIFCCWFFGGSEAQGTYAGTNNFFAGQTAVFPPGSVVTNPGGTRVLYPAGVSITFQNPTYLLFPNPTTVYAANGPIVYSSETTVLFTSGYRMSLAPGTTTIHPTTSSVTYRSFNGNTATVATYVNSATVSYNNAPTPPSYFPTGTNSINYYDPGVGSTGGTTQFGTSAPQVNSVVNKLNSDGTTSAVTCTGYTVNGWPRRSIANLQTGETQQSVQIREGRYRVTTRSGTITVQSTISYSATR